MRPTQLRPRLAIVTLFDLAPGGVYHAFFVTKKAVSSYLTFSPLPVARACWRSVFCGTFPSLTAGGRYPPSHPTEPGLSSRQNIFGTKIATTSRKMKMPISIPKNMFGQRLPGPLRFFQNRRTAHDEGQAVCAGLGCECVIRRRPQENGAKHGEGICRTVFFIV